MVDAISPDELAARLEGGDSPYLLDVRPQGDFGDWHIEGAENVPAMAELAEGRFDTVADAADDLPSDREIVTVCAAGVTAERAAAFLADRGFDARSLAGGMRGWGQVYRHYETGVPGVTQFVRPGTGCVSYVVADTATGPDGTREAVVVDPGMHLDVYTGFADDGDLDIVGAVDTHAHADHVSGGPPVARTQGLRYYLHEADAGSLSGYTPLPEGGSLQVGDRSLEVLHTPGHTPGSVSLLVDDAVLSGDTLFVAGVGRPDLEDDDEGAVRAAAGRLFDSVERLLSLPDETTVLPGHASDESERPLATTVEALTSDNEFAAVDDRAAFVDRVVDGLADTPANYRRIKRINRGEEPLDEDAETLELGPNNCAAN